MTRKEDITKKVKEIVHNSGYNAYPSYLIEIAEWADRTMLARICEWLENHDMTEHIGVLYSGVCSINFDKQGLIDALCKAMEE